MNSFRIRPPSTLAGRYVRYAMGFGAGVGVGMAPFLGKYKVPLFEPLLELFPEESKVTLIPTSAFLMGLVAVAIQFYSGEEIRQDILRRRFGMCFGITVLAFVALYALYDDRVLQIKTRTGRYVPHILGWSRLPKGEICTCEPDPKEDDKECAYALGFDLKLCWPSIPQVQKSLHLLYLTVTGGFGALIGLLALQKEKPKSAPSLPVLETPPQVTEWKSDLFLSYAHEDKAFVEVLAESLRSRGYVVWSDKEVKGGGSFVSRISESLAKCRQFAVVLSPESCRSRWVELEINTALIIELDRSKTQAPFVIPILYRECEIPLFLKSKIFVDFTHSDEQGWAELLQSLPPPSGPPQSQTS